MIFSSKYISSEAHSKAAYNHGSFEYLIQFAHRLLEQANGYIEIRDSAGTLMADLYTDNGEVIEWINPRTQIA